MNTRCGWVVNLACGLTMVLPHASVAGAFPDSALRATLTPAPDSGAAQPNAPPGHTVRPLAMRMQDSVTVLKGITIQGARLPIEDRRTATVTRLDRGMLVRFLPATSGDAL